MNLILNQQDKYPEIIVKKILKVALNTDHLLRQHFFRLASPINITTNTISFGLLSCSRASTFPLQPTVIQSSIIREMCTARNFDTTNATLSQISRAFPQKVITPEVASIGPKVAF